MPDTSSSGANGFLLGLLVVIAALYQIIMPYRQMHRYEDVTGKQLSPTRRLEVRFRMLRGVATLLLFFEIVLGFFVSPIGWLTCMGIAIFYFVTSLRLLQEGRTVDFLGVKIRRKLGVSDWLRFALTQWPAAIFAGGALIAWPILERWPHAVVAVLGALLGPLGWALLVSLSLFFIVWGIVRVRRFAPREFGQRLDTFMRPGGAGISLLILAVMLVFLQPSSGSTSSSSGSTFDPSAAATYSSFVFPTATPLVTQITVTGPVSPLLVGSVLGAPQAGFEARFGTNSSSDPKSLRYDAKLANGQPADLVVRLESGRDGLSRVAAVRADVRVDASGWNEAAARAFVVKLLPTDATVVTTDTLAANPITIYGSATEATAFDASYFQAAGGSAPQPGTIGVWCQAPNSATIYGYCAASVTGSA